MCRPAGSRIKERFACVVSPYLAVGFASAVWLISGAAYAQTLDEIIAFNLQSKGGVEKIKATETVRMSGSVVARDATGHDVTGR